MTELPEGLAGTGSAPSMRAVSDSMGDTLQLDSSAGMRDANRWASASSPQKWRSVFSRGAAKLRSP